MHSQWVLVRNKSQRKVHGLVDNVNIGFAQPLIPVDILHHKLLPTAPNKHPPITRHYLALDESFPGAQH